MPSLAFCVPASGRVELARICLRQLRRTCDMLVDKGIDATAVVVADDENLDTARDNGFVAVEKPNDFVSAKFNDAIERACADGSDYVVPLGSDDWVHTSLFNPLPPVDTMFGFQRMAFVREDGREITSKLLLVRGGCGIRIYPRQIMAKLNYRPASETLHRGCDTSILTNLWRADALPNIDHRISHPLWIVDWKTAGHQLNPYDSVEARHQSEMRGDPYETLAGVYPDEALQEMRAHYGLEVPHTNTNRGAERLLTR